MMENVTGGTADDEVEDTRVPLGKEERESLIACGTSILKEEKDDEVLESIVAMLQDVKTNAGMREGLKSFLKNGWAFIQKSQKQKSDFNLLLNSPTSFSAALKPGKPEQNLESRLNHEIHPINNDLILRKIFEFSSVSDLKNCRLVSKNWRDVSLCSWRGKAVLQAGRLFGKASDTGAALENADEFFRNSSELQTPFQRYDMWCNDNLIIGFANWFKIRNKKMMLGFFSSSIQHLSIKCDDLEMLCMLFSKLPELRVLHLEWNYQNLYREYKSIISRGRECPLQDLKAALRKLYKLELKVAPPRSPNFEIEMMNVNFPWKKIFESVPALKSFSLNCESDNLTTEILQSLCDIRKERNFSTLNLEAFNIDPLKRHHFGRLIVECQFPLQELSLPLMNNDQDDPSAILDLLEAHRETLQYFHCGIYYNDDVLSQYQRTLFLPLPLAPLLSFKVELPKLKELVLKNDCAWAFHLLSSLDVPNLEKLRILSEKSIEEDERDVLGLILESGELMGSCFLPSLNEFICEAPAVIFRLPELRILGKSMPNLTHLRISLGEDTFPIVYELWPGLESLHLVANKETYSLLDDFAITGFLAKGFADPVQVRSESCGPNITNLKNLRKFVLKTGSDGVPNLLRPRRAFIFDASAVYGFLQLSKLEILHLESVCKFSPSVMAALKDHVLEAKISEPRIFKFGFYAQRF